VPDGRVAITWLVNEAERLQLTWREQHGPTVQEPTRRSFGTRLIETMGRQLEGEVKLTYETSGFVYTLDVPLESLASPAIK
jgi:two-component sensor histidine kinase